MVGMLSILVGVVFLVNLHLVIAFKPVGYWARSATSANNVMQKSEGLAAVPKTAEDRNPFGSKLMQDVSEDELDDLERNVDEEEIDENEDVSDDFEAILSEFQAKFGPDLGLESDEND